MKTLQIYDFAMAAGGSFVLPVSGDYFRIISTTGNVSVTADTWGKLGPISRGQGLENSLYNRLTIKDESGSSNSGTILVSDSNFIDQTLYGSISLAGAVALDSATLAALEQISVRPEAQTGFWSDGTTLVANTPLTVVSPGTNTNGLIVLNADIWVFDANAHTQAFITKASAPTTVFDGSIVLAGRPLAAYSTTNQYSGGHLETAQYVAAGQGLYFIGTLALAAANNVGRSCRYKLL